jgi:tyrosyl-tRNA synthetase
MMAKDSVRKRISEDSGEGMSFTEFSYQLVQGYDYLHLYRNYQCTLQMGGSDQWGNITTGTELIRRIEGGKGFALTCPLITKADGTKFGKTESGNVWLDAHKTSPYKFYQYWLNTSDEDAEKYIKIFTFMGQEEIAALVSAHREAPHLRQLQRKLAEKLTAMVHSAEDLQRAEQASSILFGQATAEALRELGRKTFEEVFEGVPQAEVGLEEIRAGMDMIAALSARTGFLKSNGEARRELGQHSISVNKTRVDEAYTITEADLISGKYVLLQRGKKNYFVLVAREG